MALQRDYNAGLIALNRFAFGARGNSDDLNHAASDPRGYLTAELVQPAIAELNASTLPTSESALRSVYEYQAMKKEQRAEAAAAAKTDAPSMTQGPAMTTAEPGMQSGASPAPAKAGNPTDMVPGAAPPDKAMPTRPQRDIFKAEALARFRSVLHADVGFVERLVHFWSNHFCVSVAKSAQVRATAGCFEREAIRPHVLGRFTDMLLAVSQHPAMLLYLDNTQSIGPNSKAGLRRQRGLNENLARELMELHTLGVDGGYSQADVTSLAEILTGWTVAGAKGERGEPGTFVFFDNGHEPGDRSLLGKVYSDDGVTQGENALRDLARHPATAKHIAFKFARYFVADDPPKELVNRLADTFTRTDGDLKALAVALVQSDEAWSSSMTKLRSPEEFILAAIRAVDRIPDDPGPILGPLRVAGQPLWQPPGPNGWSDTSDVWSSPEGMKSRLDVSAAIAGRLRDLVNPSDLLDTLAGSAASSETKDAISRAESPQQGLALLLMSPEFQRR